MNSICTACKYAGNIHETLEKEGWVGCRKVLSILQPFVTDGTPSRYDLMSVEEISAEIYEGVTCEDAATGWVDKGPLGSRTGNSFNGILITKGTTKCQHFEKK